MNFFKANLEKIKKEGLYREFNTYTPLSATHVIVNKKKYIVLASNNYLGLTHYDKVKKAGIEAIEQYGTGSGGARLTTGSHPLYQLLEKEIAEFKGCEAALVFNTGYMANVGVISSIMEEDDVIFSDELNHASIIDGCRLSKAKCVVFKHSNMQDLEKCIFSHPCKGKRMIIVDGVFSMDGDIAPLNELVAISQKHQIMLMVDDAHATGVLGGGRGTAAHFGLEKYIDIQMGTLSKALGSEGAYVAARKEIIDYLVNKARSYIFSTALSPASIAVARASLQEIINNHTHIEKLTKNSTLMKKALKKNGIEVVLNETAIIPIIIGNAEKTVFIADELKKAGIIVSAIRPPTVKKGESRLRIAVSATHTEEELRFAARKIGEIIRKYEG